ncbi:hypothetical protein TWF694_010762 [Orbilia ellipsospora]|uniref:MARVEL domain-containing protein n=1 Tax=Orbilia ellipsospora TaxID=2528407 RepID=A0AAV9X9Y5_9PEZI
MSSTAYEPYHHVGAHGEEKPLVHERSHQSPPRPPHTRRSAPKTSSAAQHIRTTLRALVLILAATIVAIQAHATVVWLSTRNEMVHDSGTGWKMMQWAVLDISPTYTMLGISAGAVILQIIALISLCFWTHRIHDNIWRVLCIYFSSIIFIAAWIGALVYFKLVHSQGAKRTRWDVWTWTCQNRDVTNAKIPWKSLCIEMEYSFIAAIVIAVFELLSLVLFIISQCAAKKQVKYGKVTAWI